MMRFLLVLYIFVLPFTIKSQLQDTLISESDLQSYVNIKSESVVSVTNTDSIIKSVMESYGVALSRIQEIIKYGIEGKPVILTEIEKNAKIKLEKLHLYILSLRTEREQTLCIKHKISVAKYKYLDEKFRKNVAFQQTLIPYFVSKQAEK